MSTTYFGDEMTEKNGHFMIVKDMPMVDYLKHTNYLGGSMLNLLLNRPDKYKYRYIDGHSEQDTRATKVGRITHTLFMEPYLFDEEYHLIPRYYTNKDGKTCEWRENENYKHVKEDIEKAKAKTRIKESELMEASSYASALINNKFANDARKSSIIEPTMFCTVSPKVQVKSRPDMLDTKINIAYNVKTTKSLKPDDFFKTAISLGYDISAALTAYCYEKTHERKLEDYIFIVVEKSDTTPVEIFSSKDPMYGEGSMTFLQFGAKRLAKALEIYKRCTKHNLWLPFEDSGSLHTMKVPYYALKEFIDDE